MGSQSRATLEMASRCFLDGGLDALVMEDLVVGRSRHDFAQADGRVRLHGPRAVTQTGRMSRGVQTGRWNLFRSIFSDGRQIEAVRSEAVTDPRCAPALARRRRAGVAGRELNGWKKRETVDMALGNRSHQGPRSVRRTRGFQKRR